MKFEPRTGAFNMQELFCVLEPGDTDVVIPDEYKALDGIENRGELKRIVFPAGTERIEWNLLEDSPKLKEVVLPEGVTEIRRNAFKGCKSLQSINFPQSLKKIDSSAFEGCKALKSVVVGANLEEFGGFSFRNCSKLEYVQLPALAHLGFCCMAGCKNLRYIHFTGPIEGADFKSPYSPQYSLKNFVEVMELPVFFDSFAVELLPASMRKMACCGMAMAMAEGKKADPEVEKANLAYIKKNKTKLLEEAVFHHGMTELLLREGCVNAAWKEKLLNAARERKDEALIQLLSGGETQQESKPQPKAKPSKAEMERAARFQSAEEGKGGLIFACDVKFDTWERYGKRKIFQNLEELQLFLADRGMIFSDMVTGKVDYLVVPNDRKEPTAKMKKAATLGILIIKEAELRASTWPMVKKDLCSADGKTYTFDANSRFEHHMLLDGTVPESVETISISAVALLHDQTNSKRAPVAQNVLDKIQIIDVNKVKTVEDKLNLAKLVYTNYTPTTLELFDSLVQEKDQLTMLRRILPAIPCKEIHKDMTISEESFAALPSAGLFAEIAARVGKLLFGDDMMLLHFAASGQPVPKLPLLTVLVSMTREDSPKVENQLLQLVQREDLQALVAVHLPMVDQSAFFGEPLAQCIACRLCCASQAKDIVNAFRTIKRKASGFGLSNDRSSFVYHVPGYLGSNEDHEVLLYLDKVKLLKWAAAARGVDEGKLRASLLNSVDIGLDENGSMLLNYANKSIRATLLPDMSFAFRDEGTDKTYKSLPKPAEEDAAGKAAQAAFKTVRDKVKTLCAIYLNRIKAMYAEGTAMTTEKWRELFLQDRLARRMAQGVLWGVYGKEDELKKAFILQNEVACDVDGAEVKLKKTDRISVVDMAQLSGDECAAWKKLFTDENMIQPMPQVSLPVRLVPLDLIEQRYMGCHIEANKLQSLGWDIYAEEQDPALYTECITARVDYFSRHGFISGNGLVEYVEIEMEHEVPQMTGHEKRLWNQSVQQMDGYLHPENKAAQDIRLGDEEQVRMWAEIGVINAENIDQMIDMSAEAAKAEVTGLLLQMKHTWLGEDDDLTL